MPANVAVQVPNAAESATSAATVTTVNSTASLRRRPVSLICPRCKQQVTTVVEWTYKPQAHICAVCLCLCCCWPCVCVPYCMDSCQSANHYCPNCNSYIGTFEN